MRGKKNRREQGMGRNGGPEPAARRTLQMMGKKRGRRSGNRRVRGALAVLLALTAAWCLAPGVLYGAQVQEEMQFCEITLTPSAPAADGGISVDILVQAHAGSSGIKKVEYWIADAPDGDDGEHTAEVLYEDTCEEEPGSEDEDAGEEGETEDEEEGSDDGKDPDSDLSGAGEEDEAEPEEEEGEAETPYSIVIPVRLLLWEGGMWICLSRSDDEAAALSEEDRDLREESAVEELEDDDGEEPEDEDEEAPGDEDEEEPEDEDEEEAEDGDEEETKDDEEEAEDEDEEEPEDAEGYQGILSWEGSVTIDPSRWQDREICVHVRAFDFEGDGCEASVQLLIDASPSEESDSDESGPEAAEDDDTSPSEGADSDISPSEGADGDDAGPDEEAEDEDAAPSKGADSAILLPPGRPDIAITIPPEKPDTAITIPSGKPDAGITIPSENPDTGITILPERPDTVILVPPAGPDSVTTPPAVTPEGDDVTQDEEAGEVPAVSGTVQDSDDDKAQAPETGGGDNAAQEGTYPVDIQTEPAPDGKSPAKEGDNVVIAVRVSEAREADAAQSPEIRIVPDRMELVLANPEAALSDAGGWIAENSGKNVAIFIGDRGEPEIRISGVEDGHGYSGAVSPEIEVYDRNLSVCEITLTRSRMDEVDVDVTDLLFPDWKLSDQGGEILASALEPTWDNDGIYTLHVRVTDESGNESEESVTFSVNRYGSVYVFSDYLISLIRDGGSYTQSVEEDLVITEYNVDRLIDDSRRIDITRDGKPVENVICQFSFASGGWYEYRYVIGKENFTQNGVYKLTLHSEDEAGNTSDAAETTGWEIQFCVDNKAPEITGNVKTDESGILAEGENFDYAVYDTMGLQSVEIYLNGESLGGEITDFAEDRNNYVGSLAIEGTAEEQEVRLVATDLAGNTSDILYSVPVGVYTLRQMIASPGTAIDELSRGGILIPCLLGAAAAAAVLLILFSLKKIGGAEKDDGEYHMW